MSKFLFVSHIIYSSVLVSTEICWILSTSFVLDVMIDLKKYNFNLICCSSLLLFIKSKKTPLFWQQSKVSKIGSKYQFIDGNGFVRVPCLWNIEYRTSYFHNGSPVITFGNIPKHINCCFFISNIAFKIILERRLLWCL